MGIGEVSEKVRKSQTLIMLLQTSVMEKAAKYIKDRWQETITYPWTTYKDPDIRRQFKKQSVLGYAALDGEKFGKVRPIKK
jgi:hypothetical protein